MVIGLEYLLPRVRRGELIKHLSQRDLESPEGAGFDLRVGEIYRLGSSGFLGITHRETGAIDLLGRYEEGKTQELKLASRHFYLVKLIEEISLDPDMLGIFHPRSSLFRSGVIMQTSVHPPGYSGAPTFGLYVAGDYPFSLELGARIVHINILRVEGGSMPYRGQWQGGRVTTKAREKQI